MPSRTIQHNDISRYFSAPSDRQSKHNNSSPPSKKRPASPSPQPTVSRDSHKDADPSPDNREDKEIAHHPKKRRNMPITHEEGDLFSAPPASILTHACNAQGTWGAGVALAFKAKYPRAFTVYATYCAKHSASALVGTALLIPPAARDRGRAGTDYIACLFTRDKPGFPRSLSKSRVEQEIDKTLAATEAAMRDLLAQLAELNGEFGNVVMPRINAGLFRCPWEQTESVLRDVLAESGLDTQVVVYTPAK